jgi:hypothetical protein
MIFSDATSVALRATLGAAELRAIVSTAFSNQLLSCSFAALAIPPRLART